MNFNISELDSRRFGIEVAKLECEVEDVNRMLTEMESLGVNLIIVRIKSENIRFINELENAGFKYKDTQVTMSCTLDGHLYIEEVSKISIVPAMPEHLSELQEIARNGFDGYGHYFADSRLDRKLCSEIYVDWITRACHNKNVADFVLVAIVEDKVAGFLALKKESTLANQILKGVIGAVSHNFRNRGIFKHLNHQAMKLAMHERCRTFENNILITNYPVSRVYTQLQFNIIRSEMTFHKWLGE